MMTSSVTLLSKLLAEDYFGPRAGIAKMLLSRAFIQPAEALMHYLLPGGKIQSA
jgi:hypothetical protein